jgi:branched-chain amino acid transport system substrate-binding protein
MLRGMAAEEIRAFGSVAQLKVGQPNDYPTNASDTIDSLRLVFDEAVATGLVDRPIELVQRQVVAAS